MLSNHYLPKKKKNNKLLCHIKKFLQHFRIVKGITPSRP